MLKERLSKEMAREAILSAGVITDYLQSAIEGDTENLDAEVNTLLLLTVSSLP